jgi:hypothetical protein
MEREKKRESPGCETERGTTYETERWSVRETACEAGRYREKKQSARDHLCEPERGRQTDSDREKRKRESANILSDKMIFLGQCAQLDLFTFLFSYGKRRFSLQEIIRTWRLGIVLTNFFPLFFSSLPILC